MPRGNGIYDNEDTEEPTGGRPGPKDDRGLGGMATRDNAGMATRDNAPDVDESSEEPTA
jgi:hypothetical protein